MKMDEYLSKLEAIGDAIDKNLRLQYDMELVKTLGVDEEIFQWIKELMPMASEILTEDDLKWGQVNCLRIERIRIADISYNDKILMGAIYCLAMSLGREQRFLRYFEPYHENHPIFADTHLSEKKRDREMISLDGCKIINDHIFSDGHYFRLGYYKEAMVKYLEEVKDKYKTFVRVDPYVVLDKQPPKELLEFVVRPIDPKWIEKLRIYPGNMTAGEYVLQAPSMYPASRARMTSEEELAYLEYHLYHIRKLDVYAARGNNKNLHMMIEELKEDAECEKYFIGKCIHLDTNDVVGTDFTDSVLNHIDLAINVYDKPTFDVRKQQSLAHGKVIDATIRTHIMRVENVPFSHLPQVAADFLDSRTLYLEWMDDMFGGKDARFPFIRE